MSNIVTIEIKTRGIQKIESFMAEVENMPKNAILPAMLELTDLGVDAGKISLWTQKTEKSTGNLAKSFEGLVHTITEEHRQIELGSDLWYAKFAGSDIGPTTMNRPVQVWPFPIRWGYQPLARWRFIGTRPAMKAHPFLKDSVTAVRTNLSDVFGKHLLKFWGVAVSKAQMEPEEP